jgi:beta-lactam-binding protein with PASTA domain
MVTGESIERAQDILERHGLRGIVQNEVEGSPLVVMRQDPAPRAVAPRSREVRLWVGRSEVETPRTFRPVQPARPVATVPDVTGRTFEGAQEALIPLDLEAVIAGRELSRMREGLVVRQAPPPGTPRSDVGSVVELVMSLGPRVVPGVLDRPSRQASLELRRAGFRFEVAGREESGAPAGFVVRQDPAPGTETVDPDLVVRLWVSTGLPDEPEPPRVFTVPDVLWEQVEQAAERLGAEGFGSDIVAWEPSERPRGLVIRQDPPGGTNVRDRGLTVRLWVSEGPRPTVSVATPVATARPTVSVPAPIATPQRPDGWKRTAPRIIGFAVLFVALMIGVMRWISRRGGPEGRVAGTVTVHPRVDLGDQTVEAPGPLRSGVEIELHAVPDVGEARVVVDGPLIAD